MAILSSLNGYMHFKSETGLLKKALSNYLAPFLYIEQVSAS